MDFGYLPVEGGHHDRPHAHEYEQQNRTLGRTITPLPIRLATDRTPSYSSSESSEPETVVRWHTPPQAAPTPPGRSTETILPSQENRQSLGANESAHTSSTPLVVRFDEAQIQATEAEAARREAERPSREGKMDVNEVDSSPPSPGTDDTPYIRFAIDQLTRDQELQPLQRPSTTASSDSYPVERVVSDYGLGYMSAEKERETLRLIRKHRSSPPHERLFNFNATRPLPFHSDPLEANPLRQKRAESSDPQAFIAVDPPPASRYPNLMFVPMILRPVSIVLLSCLCIFMIAAFMLCAIYSTTHHGLVDWYGGIYGGRYFVFSFLPQILAAVIFIYVQCVMVAVTRIMPYTLMAMDDVDMRANALFLNLFPRNMLWPHWEGPILIKISSVGLWFSVWTIPLQSCLFSATQIDGTWKWTTVQGIAWTLVVVYVLVLGGTVLTGVFFLRRTTGLMWDPRSLADVITLLPRSNVLSDFLGTETMRNKEDIRHKLHDRTDRLGYWRTQVASERFYCIGEEGMPSTQQSTLQAGKLREKPSQGSGYIDLENGNGGYDLEKRCRFLPWLLRDTFVIFWSVSGFVFLLALFIISFLPSTAIRNGFPPLVDVLPNSAGFSSANFVYSFIPSVIGMLLYLLFQPLDMAIRQLQPWAALRNPNGGATAERSLLLDYVALVPGLCTIKALRLGHWRVAMTSLVSLVALLLPVLAGGLFFPLTTPESEVRMIPNLGSYYVVLVVLVIYLVGLLSLIPARKHMYMPHGTGCLAEVYSFVYQSQMVDDAAFRAPRGKEDLKQRLCVERIGGTGEVNTWEFGSVRARDGSVVLGVEKVGRRPGPGAGGVLDGERMSLVV